MLSIRPSKENDIEKIVSYFLESEPAFIKGMGADITKLPKRENWIAFLQKEFNKPFTQKGYYYIIWMHQGVAIGHCNINNIIFGSIATIHLHVWDKKNRQKGYGEICLRMTIPKFFEQFELEKLICEPFSKNESPNRTLLKVGFKFVKAYDTKPGKINLFQTVKRYKITKEQVMRLEESV